MVAAFVGLAAASFAKTLDAFASMGDAPPTRGAKDLFRRLSDGVAERAAALEEVERNEYSALLRAAGN